MAIKCPSCGADNPDHAFFCGKCAKELPRVPSTHEPDPTKQAQPTVSTESRDEQQPDPQVAIAINVRRIVLILLLGIVLLVGGNLLGLWVTNSDMDFQDVRTAITLWGVLSTLIIAFGVFYIVFAKRVTKLSPGREKRKGV